MGPLVGSVLASVVYIIMIKHHWPEEERDEKEQLKAFYINGIDNASFKQDSQTKMWSIEVHSLLKDCFAPVNCTLW